MANYITTILLLTFASAVLAQYDGPAPPRLAIPGAIPLPIRNGPVRGERVLPSAPGVLRIRRPAALRPSPVNAAQVSAPRFLEPEPRPVTEEPEDDLPQAFIPQLLAQAQPQIPHFNQQENHDEHEIQQSIVARLNHQDNRPVQQIQRAQIPERFFSTDKEVSSNAQRFALTSEKPQARQQQFRPAPPPPRPAFREQQRQQFEEQPARHQAEQRPHTKTADSERRRKPVAQILRKYRDENEDGTITWGFENDDGSYKEEVIGTDCVTRGRYGYIDPDGLKREYSYETGILCDPLTRLNVNEEDDEPIIDYQENKAILPNGQRIDLSNMGKTKSKRPQQFYRN